MSFLVAYHFITFVVILTKSTNLPVKAQPTAEVCENENSLNTIVAEIEQLFSLGDAFRQKQNEEVQSIHWILNAALQQMQDQQDIVVTSLRAVDRRSEEQVQSTQLFLNASFRQIKNQLEIIVSSLQAVEAELDMQNLNVSLQQMKNQQNTVVSSLQAFDRRTQKQELDMQNLSLSLQQMKNQQNTVVSSLQAFDRRTQKQELDMQNLNVSLQQMKNQQDTIASSLQAVDRRSQEQDMYIKQVQTIHRLLNVSHEQTRTQHATASISLEAIDRRLRDHNVSAMNAIQNSWKLAMALGVDLQEGLVLPPIVNNWIILMHRYDRSVTFNRNWVEYRNGFGNIGQGEFWLGNEKIHRLTNRFFYKLRIEVQLKSNSQWYYANYDTFSIDSEGSKYTLRLSGFSGGTAGDSLTNTSLHSDGCHGGMSFSTFDADNDRWSGNCAQDKIGGWWFNACHSACLTCTYDFTYFQWYSLMHVSPHGLLRAARMMIKSK